MVSKPQTVFFSYSPEDSEFALPLAARLRAAGADVWIDKWEALTPGQKWLYNRHAAMNKCPTFLVILSPSSLTSPEVMSSTDLAIQEGKRVIPVLYRECEVPLRLRRLQYVDFRTDYDCGLKTLLETLGAL